MENRQATLMRFGAPFIIILTSLIAILSITNLIFNDRVSLEEPQPPVEFGGLPEKPSESIIPTVTKTVVVTQETQEALPHETQQIPTRTATVWVSVYPLSPFNVAPNDMKRWATVKAEMFSVDPLLVYDVLKYPWRDPEDPSYPVLEDPYFKTLHNSLGINPGISEQRMFLVGQVAYGCNDCDEDYLDLVYSIEPVEICYLIERYYDTYGLINIWLYNMMVGNRIFYSLVYRYAPRIEIDQMVQELQEYQKPENPMYLRMALGKSSYLYYTGQLAPYVLQWYQDEYPECTNLSMPLNGGKAFE